MKTAWLTIRRMIYLCIVWAVGEQLIPTCIAVDNFDTCKQKWAEAIADIRSPAEPSDDSNDYETWGWINQITTHCPHYPGIVDPLFAILDDDNRREEWMQSIQCIDHVVRGGVVLSNANVESLARVLPQVDVYDRRQGLWLLGACKQSAEIAIEAIRPDLVNDHVAIRTFAAASVLRLKPTDETAKQILLMLSASPEISERQRAVRMIGSTGLDIPQFADALRAALKDVDSGVRVLAACSLWEMTRSEDESLPVLISSLSDEIVYINLDAVTFASRTYPSQFLAAISCLGEMSGMVPSAQQVLEDIARKRIQIADDWRAISMALLSANGAAKYPGMQLQEITIHTALDDDGAFSEIAKAQLTRLTAAEMAARLELFEAFRKQEARWKESNSLE